MALSATKDVWPAYPRRFPQEVTNLIKSFIPRDRDRRGATRDVANWIIGIPRKIIPGKQVGLTVWIRDYWPPCRVDSASKYISYNRNIHRIDNNGDWNPEGGFPRGEQGYWSPSFIAFCRGAYRRDQTLRDMWFECEQCMPYMCERELNLKYSTYTGA